MTKSRLCCRAVLWQLTETLGCRLESVGKTGQASRYASEGLAQVVDGAGGARRGREASSLSEQWIVKSSLTLVVSLSGREMTWSGLAVSLNSRSAPQYPEAFCTAHSRRGQYSAFDNARCLVFHGKIAPRPEFCPRVLSAKRHSQWTDKTDSSCFRGKRAALGYGGPNDASWTFLISEICRVPRIHGEIAARLEFRSGKVMFAARTKRGPLTPAGARPRDNLSYARARTKGHALDKIPPSAPSDAAFFPEKCVVAWLCLKSFVPKM